MENNKTVPDFCADCPKFEPEPTIQYLDVHGKRRIAGWCTCEWGKGSPSPGSSLVEGEPPTGGRSGACIRKHEEKTVAVTAAVEKYLEDHGQSARMWCRKMAGSAKDDRWFLDIQATENIGHFMNILALNHTKITLCYRKSKNVWEASASNSTRNKYAYGNNATEALASLFVA